MSDQTQHKHSKQLSTNCPLVRNNKNQNQTDQLQLLHAIRNILSGERDFNEGYMFCNEVVCIRPLSCIAIFHSRLYFTTSIRILLKQTIIEHELSLSSCLSTGVFSMIFLTATMATTHDNVDDCGDFQNQRRDSWLE